MQGAREVASSFTYFSSAEVRSISLVKWFMQASSVAILVSRNCERVCCRTGMRAKSVVSVVGVAYMVLMISYT